MPRKATPSIREPRASRPYMPGYGILDARSGKGLLPWSWARERLSTARRYWVATARPDGTPHAMPVWGIWVDDAFYFSTGRKSRKARNLAANPQCVVSCERGNEAVIVEGLAREATDRRLVRRLSEPYRKKYQSALDPRLGPIFAVRPRVAFGFIESEQDFPATATRWKFEDQR